MRNSFWHRKLYMKTWCSQKLFLSDFFGTFCPKIHIRKNLKQFSNYTWKLDIVQNVLLPGILLISVDQNVSILFVNDIYTGNIRTFWHRKLYMKPCYCSKSLWILTIFLVWFLSQNLLISPSSKISLGAVVYYLRFPWKTLMIWVS